MEILKNQKETKNKGENVHFQDVVLMSMDDFKNGKVEDWQDKHNVRIEQDFSAPNEKRKSLSGTEYEDTQMTQLMKRMKSKEYQRIEYKKVIDDLDQWNSELKQRKRQEVSNKVQLYNKQEDSEVRKNMSLKIKISTNSKDQKKEKEEVGDPELNIAILNSIMAEEKDIFTKNQKKEYLTSREGEQGGGDLIQSSNSLIPFDLSPGVGSKTHLNFPTQMNLASQRPMTLTSLKMKKVEDIKCGSVSRYMRDKDNQEVMKTDDQLQAEQNNQIINQIFKSKIARVIEVQRPTSKSEYFEMIKHQSALFKKETLGHFKSLSYLSSTQNNGHMRKIEQIKYGEIQYEKLYSELFEEKLMKRDPKLEEEQKILLSQTKYLDEKEKNLLSQYMRQIDTCRMLKEQLQKMRVFLNVSNIKRKNKATELKDEFNQSIQELEEENMAINKQQDAKKRLFDSNFPSFNDNNMAINKQQDVKKRLFDSNSPSFNDNNISDEDSESLQITDLNKEQNEIFAEVDAMMKEYEIAKEQKNSLKYTLKLHYLAGLKKGANEKTNKSLVWIIIKLFQIHEEVTYNIFPDYLDGQNIQFLLSYAKLEQTKQDTLTKIKQMQHSLSSNDGVVKNAQQDQAKQKQCYTPSQMKNSRIKKSVVELDQDQKGTDNEMAFQMQKDRNYSRYTDRENIPNSSHLNNQNFMDLRQLESQVKQIENQIGEIKAKEMDRIINQAIKENKDCKNIFFSLFNQMEAHKCMAEYERKKQKDQQAKAANKTFNFSTAFHSKQNSLCNPNRSSVIPFNNLTQRVLSVRTNLQNNGTNSYSLPVSQLEPFNRNKILLGIRTEQSIPNTPCLYNNFKERIKEKDAFSVFLTSPSNFQKLSHVSTPHTHQSSSVSSNNKQVSFGGENSALEGQKQTARNMQVLGDQKKNGYRLNTQLSEWQENKQRNNDFHNKKEKYQSVLSLI